jgi:molecular chaperone HtpG
MEKVEFNVIPTPMGETGEPLILTQSEYMRRMKEMATIQPGMSFYGEMPDMYNLMLNTDHTLVKEVLADVETKCAESLSPIQKEMDDVDKQRKTIRDSYKGKKDEEIPQVEKDTLSDLDKRWDALKADKNNIYATYATNNQIIRQLIDLSLLQNGMLKGEALTNFVKRSLSLIK